MNLGSSPLVLVSARPYFLADSENADISASNDRNYLSVSWYQLLYIRSYAHPLVHQTDNPHLANTHCRYQCYSRQCLPPNYGNGHTQYSSSAYGF